MDEARARILKDFMPGIISGILVVLAFPLFDLGFFAWVSMVPLLLSLWGKDSDRAFKIGYVFGLVYFFGTLYWVYHSINHFGGISFIPSIAIVLVLCAYLSLAQGPSSFTTSRITNHLLTNLWVIQQFIQIRHQVEGGRGKGGKVTIIP